MELSKPQKKVLISLQDFINEHGFSPTTRELAKAAGYSSTAPVRFHLKNLRSLGYIDYIDGESRTITVLKNQYIEIK